MNIFDQLSTVIEEFRNWLQGNGLNSLGEFVEAFNELNPYLVVLFLVFGVILALFGRKIFWPLFCLIWALIGFSYGYQWGEQLQGAFYQYELAILCGVLLAILSIQARKFFMFLIAMVSTMFLLLYILTTLGFDGLKLIDLPFVIVGILIGIFAVKMLPYLIIGFTSLSGSFIIGLGVDRFTRGLFPKPLGQVIFFIIALIASLYVQFRWYKKDTETTDSVDTTYIEQK
ncbi:MAG: DUF4203 domain-containing protein [Thermotogota bacterium]|nr:DUF4203 domain-containing protein [Thermotogota bacterium]